ncbi:hypothetical protein ACTXG6_11720 [Pseudonocardia sp. Cha107L01]|uniref:hypothetical protein n=1 Tax=Pseudonocardia sp. Cha107L01 TaxID=3457576 RepID=UPI00403EF3E6
MLSKRTLVNPCPRLRPETDNLIVLAGVPERLVTAGVKLSLRGLARRWKVLEDEIKTLNRQLEALVPESSTPTCRDQPSNNQLRDQ